MKVLPVLGKTKHCARREKTLCICHYYRASQLCFAFILYQCVEERKFQIIGNQTKKKLITVFIHTLSDLPSLIGNPLTPQAGPITF